MKRLIFFVTFCIALLYQSCSEPLTTDTGNEPKPPHWVELSIKIDSLPAAGKTGSIQSTFVINGDGQEIPVFNNNSDTLNFIRIALNPDKGANNNTNMVGDTIWEGEIKFNDTIIFKTDFVIINAPYNYFEIINGKYIEFNWAVDFLIGFYYQSYDGQLYGYFGNPNPSAPFNNPSYATLYVNTISGETFLKVHALKNN